MSGHKETKWKAIHFRYEKQLFSFSSHFPDILQRETGFSEYEHVERRS